MLRFSDISGKTDWRVLTDDERALAALERERLAVYYGEWAYANPMERVTTRDNVLPDMLFRTWLDSTIPFIE